MKKLIIILGPTGSGKTEMAIKLAGKFNSEIVSADSRQIYKKMDIATGKPLKKQMKAVPHYLIDIIKPNQNFNVAIYKRLAIEKIKEIQKRGRIPFLVGGTGLYISSIVNNIDFPKVIPQKNLREKLEKKTLKQLFEIYKKLDTQGAQFIEKNNKRRLIRAIEVCKITKKSFWEQRKKKEPIFDILQIGIKLSKQELEKRIIKRTEKMFKQGLEKEAQYLIKKYGVKIPSMRTIGYQEWLQEHKKDEVKQKIILHTLQFTKRQMTWFKKIQRLNWIRNYSQAEKLLGEFLF